MLFGFAFLADEEKHGFYTIVVRRTVLDSTLQQQHADHRSIDIGDERVRYSHSATDASGGLAFPLLHPLE